jgi:hypothetical protein
MAPIFEDGNNKKDPPREEDLFDRSSPGKMRSESRAGRGDDNVLVLLL